MGGGYNNQLKNNNMTFETFKQVILLLKKEEEKSQKIYELGLDTYEFLDNYHTIINMLIRSHYSEIGEDFISWWLYEDTEKTLFDNDGNTINDLTDIKDLWEYVENIRKSTDFIEYTPKHDLSDKDIEDLLKSAFN